MEIVQSGRKYLAMLGIGPDHNFKTVKCVFASFVYVTNVGGNLGFFFYDAETFLEYANSIFITATITMVAVCFGILALQSSHITAIIDLGTSLVTKSEFSSIYFFFAIANHSIMKAQNLQE